MYSTLNLNGKLELLIEIGVLRPCQVIVNSPFQKQNVPGDISVRYYYITLLHAKHFLTLISCRRGAQVFLLSQR